MHIGFFIKTHMENQTLSTLRKSLTENKLDAIIIPSSDPHNSEYIPEHYKSRAWISGFTGSAGTAVITQKHAGLWADSRYFIQAESELSTPFELHRLITREPEYALWLAANLQDGDRIGIDANTFPVGVVNYIEDKLKDTGISLINIGDLISKVWLDRPTMPNGDIVDHEVIYCGESRSDKIDRIKENLRAIKADAVLISTLDDIAWTLNLRGNEISYNPVFYAYLWVGMNKTIAFVDSSKMDELVQMKLDAVNIELLPYHELESFIKNTDSEHTLAIDKANLNMNVFELVKNKFSLIETSGLVSALKAIKNDKEIENYKMAQKRDGAAMVNFLNWVDENGKKGTYSEIDFANRLEKFRKNQDHFKGLSFTTISAYGRNAALPHYSVSDESNTLIETKGMYLVDSGGQYVDGTTDITRTIAMGACTEVERKDFTLVLKGHIQVAMAKFPIGTKGFQIDTLARSAMWKHGRNFGHGTGHGIGFYLNVHEGPQGLSPAGTGAAAVSIEPGMLITNEPGIYIEGSHGIRTENVLLCVKDETHEGFLKFETLTLCPIDKSLIIKELLNDEELVWLNNYHMEVYEQLAPVLCQSVKTWLAEQTSAL